MNLKKFKKFALTTKKTQQITGGALYYCYNEETGQYEIVDKRDLPNYPPNACSLGF